MTSRHRLAFRLSSALLLGFAGLGGAGCTVTSTVATCGVDNSLACAAGATGETCTGGATPDTTSQTCSIPTTMPDGSDGYCCFAFASSSSTCTPDETVTGCQYPSYGFSCAAGDDPTSLDPSLNCSVPTPSGNEDLFCCQ